MVSSVGRADLKCFSCILTLKSLLILLIVTSKSLSMLCVFVVKDESSSMLNWNACVEVVRVCPWCMFTFD